MSQKLRLRCRQCGTRAVYDVGVVLIAPAEQDEDPASARPETTFTNYFRCKGCASGGPWDVEDRLRLLGLMLRAKVDRKFQGVAPGRFGTFDGTLVQTPALGEEHLLKLLKAQPRNAFLHTRLGNLLRACALEGKATEWYEKALALDPGDVEARYHLFYVALAAGNLPGLLTHAPLLVRYLLQGRTTDKEDLDEGMAWSVAEKLRSAPESFRQHFLGLSPEAAQRKENLFIRTLLTQQGDEKAILGDAAERLLEGEPAPALASGAVSPATAEASLPTAIALVPSLEQAVQIASLNAERLSVVFEASSNREVRILDKHSVHISDGKTMTGWKVSSLRELFRGNRRPPADMDHYPPEYAPLFFLIENQFLTLCDAMGDRTDQEMEELYSALRRRPDGRSLGVVHDFLWQVCALLLGQHVLSEAEFGALIGALVRSTRKWSQRPVSRNYVDYLRQTFKDAHSATRFAL